MAAPTGAMIPTLGLDPPALLAAQALVGRLLLSVLPPGLPGRHAASELPATWAASHLLGGLALALELGAARSLGLDPGAIAVLAPWLLLALARWLTLPGAMVPRHDLPHEAPGGLARSFRAAAPLVLVAAASLRASRGSADSILLPAADGLALLALASHGLASARRSPLARSAAVLLLAGALAAAITSPGSVPASSSLALPLSIGGGAAFGIAWLRRADRRAGALALLAFASAACLGPREALFGAAGVLALWIHTAPPSRPVLATFALAAFVPATALGWSRRAPDLELASLLPFQGIATVLVVALALATRHRLLLARERRAEVDPPAHQGGARPPAAAAASRRLGSAMLRDAVILSILPPITRGELGSLELLPVALLPVAPLLALEAGFAFGRGELDAQPPARDGRAQGSPSR